MIASQPTRGIDIGSANYIHHQLIDMRNNGAAILLISADLNEVCLLYTSNERYMIFLDYFVC